MSFWLIVSSGLSCCCISFFSSAGFVRSRKNSPYSAPQHLKGIRAAARSRGGTSLLPDHLSGGKRVRKAVLTRSQVTGSFFFVFRYRLPIVLLIFFFSLFGSLNYFCLLENEVSTRSASQTPISISCLDNKEGPFLSQGYHGHKKIYFPKIERMAINAHRATFLQEGPSYPNPLGPSGAVFVPLTIPIYQLKTAYRI